MDKSFNLEKELMRRKNYKVFKYQEPLKNIWFEAEVSYSSNEAEYQINMSASGSQSPEVTRRMAEVTLKAVKYANDLNEKLEDKKGKN